MALILEDGTGVEDANTYVSVQEARDIATSRGLVLSSDETILSGNLVSSADRITSYENRFSGVRMNGVQGLSYPRNRSYRYGSVYPNTSIPKELKLAQVTLAALINEGVEIWTSSSAGIKEETVGPLTTIYSDSAADSVGNPALPIIESILDPLFVQMGINFLVGR